MYKYGHVGRTKDVPVYVSIIAELERADSLPKSHHYSACVNAFLIYHEFYGNCLSKTAGYISYGRPIADMLLLLAQIVDLPRDTRTNCQCVTIAGLQMRGLPSNARICYRIGERFFSDI
ncbi:hypothetical protein TrispH2_006291 [Trichoplax sp. H2]|nr:hypothetical protein TrispH2_006291 [Trichoplax sp. H2]|eukprot:RDD41617.1 hypothetical protein TrispH2_006291 [Trichoplax sp. H2]